MGSKVKIMEVFLSEISGENAYYRVVYPYFMGFRILNTVILIPNTDMQTIAIDKTATFTKFDNCFTICFNM